MLKDLILSTIFFQTNLQNFNVKTIINIGKIIC